MPTSTGRGDKKYHYNKMKITSVFTLKTQPENLTTLTPKGNPKANKLAFKEQALLSLNLALFLST